MLRETSTSYRLTHIDHWLSWKDPDIAAVGIRSMREACDSAAVALQTSTVVDRSTAGVVCRRWEWRSSASLHCSRRSFETRCACFFATLGRTRSPKMSATFYASLSRGEHLSGHTNRSNWWLPVSPLHQRRVSYRAAGARVRCRRTSAVIDVHSRSATRPTHPSSRWCRFDADDGRFPWSSCGRCRNYTSRSLQHSDVVTFYPVNDSRSKLLKAQSHDRL